MKRMLILGAGAVGFLLGSRAGRQPYEQFMRTIGQLKDDPRVQEKAHQGAQLVREQAPVVADKVAGAARSATDKVTSTVSGSGGSDTDELIEEAVQYQKDTGPKGPLP
ncbi:YtxH domain-containing protein [Terrabacter sp. NPDC080008]|uniref:YtxH domain-containing protein n=1 Tax=Terrabacter sp. NPDC080008 TaxID=3155176 RepID=UPI00344E9BEC